MEKFDFMDIAIVTIKITNIVMKKFEFTDIAISHSDARKPECQSINKFINKS